MPTPKRPMIPWTLSAYAFVMANGGSWIAVLATAGLDRRSEQGRHNV